MYQLTLIHGEIAGEIGTIYANHWRDFRSVIGTVALLEEDRAIDLADDVTAAGENLEGALREDPDAMTRIKLTERLSAIMSYDHPPTLGGLYEAPKHVWIEAPGSLTNQQADRLRQAAVAHNEGRFEDAQDLVDSVPGARMSEYVPGDDPPEHAVYASGNVKAEA